VSKVHVSDAAKTDLILIKQYISSELGSPAAANKAVRNITKSISRLKDNPEIGAKLSSVIGIETNYRYLVCGNYLAFYRIEGLGIFVDRVLYGRRDYIRVLFDEPMK
jgi:plasmid stabilization system protein ParE